MLLKNVLILIINFLSFSSVFFDSTMDAMKNNRHSKQEDVEIDVIRKGIKGKDTVKAYKCHFDKCPRFFYGEVALYIHIMTRHSKTCDTSGVWSCYWKDCNEDILYSKKNPSIIEDHLHKHICDYMACELYVCQFGKCRNFFYKAQNFYNHVNKKHCNLCDESWQCLWNGCIREYSTNDSYRRRRHLRIHTRQNTCFYCSRSYADSNQFKKHFCKKNN